MKNTPVKIISLQKPMSQSMNSDPWIVDPMLVGLACFFSLLLGGIIGFPWGYIKGRWGGSTQDALVVTPETIEALRKIKLDSCPDIDHNETGGEGE